MACRVGVWGPWRCSVLGSCACKVLRWQRRTGGRGALAPGIGALGGPGWGWGGLPGGRRSPRRPWTTAAGRLAPAAAAAGIGLAGRRGRRRPGARGREAGPGRPPCSRGPAAPAGAPYRAARHRSSFRQPEWEQSRARVGGAEARARPPGPAPGPAHRPGPEEAQNSRGAGGAGAGNPGGMGGVGEARPFGFSLGDNSCSLDSAAGYWLPASRRSVQLQD